MPTRTAAATAAAVGLALALSWGSASAQLRLGVAGGPVYPAGELGDVVGRGFAAGAVLDAGFPLFPLGLRGDVAFQYLPATGPHSDLHQLSATLNARFSVLPLPVLSPYLTAGVGVYSSDFHHDLTAPEPGRTTETGFNAGVGVRVNLIVFRPFLEARYHRVMADPVRGFVPVTVGVFF